ncbi:MAG: hypothetical protein JWO05_3846 [Gemmatimonadetes bacterium]|nr:hypothetical protein [Gemmatimonadota bacterium]
MHLPFRCRLALLLLAPVALGAQATTQPQVIPQAAAVPAAAVAAPATPAAPTLRTLAIPDCLEFTAATTENMSSKSATEGDRFVLVVTDDIKVDGVVVIAKGATVKGVVTEAKGAGFMGRGGKLNVRLESTTLTSGDKVSVRASKARAGDNNTGATVALTVLFGPIGLLKHGNDAEIKSGTIMTLYTDEAKSITVSHP